MRGCFRGKVMPVAVVAFLAPIFGNCEPVAVQEVPGHESGALQTSATSEAAQCACKDDKEERLKVLLSGSREEVGGDRDKKLGIRIEKPTSRPDFKNDWGSVKLFSAIFLEYENAHSRAEAEDKKTEATSLGFKLVSFTSRDKRVNPFVEVKVSYQDIDKSINGASFISDTEKTLLSGGVGLKYKLDSQDRFAMTVYYGGTLDEQDPNFEKEEAGFAFSYNIWPSVQSLKAFF